MTIPNPLGLHSEREIQHEWLASKAADDEHWKLRVAEAFTRYHAVAEAARQHRLCRMEGGNGEGWSLTEIEAEMDAALAALESDITTS